RSSRVAREDPVLCVRLVGAREVGRGGREVPAEVGPEADLARLESAIPPDLVAAPIRATEEVARGEVLDRDAVGLEDDDAIAPGRIAARIERTRVLVVRLGGALRSTGLRAVGDDRVAGHAA